MARFVTIAALLVLAALGASADYEIVPDVASSGSQDATSADYAFTATVGQVAIGLAASADYALCSGFWCKPPEQPGIIIPGTSVRLTYSFTLGQIALVIIVCAIVSIQAALWVNSFIIRLWRRA
jgi:hypothetical protein